MSSQVALGQMVNQILINALSKHYNPRLQHNPLKSDNTKGDPNQINFFLWTPLQNDYRPEVAEINLHFCYMSKSIG